MAEKNSLNLKIQQTIDSIEEHKFEPIKGFPMLHWKGKRPFSSTQYFPAQLKETHGEEVNNWINKIFWGDNMQVMSHLLKEYRGQIDLICIDPPFDSKADYKKKIELKGNKIENDRTSFEEKQYTDIWTNDEYLQFMYERLILLRELLSDTGSIIVHVDSSVGHYLKIIMDEVFGNSNFRNEIIWGYSGGSAVKSYYPKKHDNLFWYTKTNEWTFNIQHRPYSEKTIERGLTAIKGDYELSDEGASLMSYWTDKNVEKILSPTAYENLKYPTQKPESLLTRLILGHSKVGDIVFDCFMGSGTAQAVAMKLGRRFIGADINLGAIQTTTKRLIGIVNDLNGKLQEETKYTGFQVYNVNHYDVFRNPLEAKELLLKALEIQPLPNNSIYDGEKDGKMVKIMPINRIATRADLNELITNFDYKKLEKLTEANPNKPVESILLVCMGHEPDLSAELQNAVPFKLDIEVVDILKDKANLEFKRDAEAEIVIEGGKLLIREFYPMNLLQKLSLMKENVENWKELTDSIMIDFNYDEGVFTPQIVDIPNRRELVKGVYPIPANSGKIRVKITDLLSESIEVTINN
jgi:DNA modification methylase